VCGSCIPRHRGVTGKVRPTAHDASLLEVQRLSKRFGGLRAVDDLSFAVRDREILALLGPNGSGKTTVFNLIAGAFRPDDGDIYFHGRRITAYPASRRAHLGIARTFQLVRTFPQLTVLENVLVAALYGRQGAPWVSARAEAAALLTALGLHQLGAHPAASLTLGERKKLEIARALAARPRLLLLDEPTAGLSAPDVQALLSLFARVRADGLALLIVEHNVRAIRALCDRAIILNSGRKLAEGPPASVLAHPRVVQAYLGAP
jgi:branched-chain amino acid transport system ATP-binding protein